MTVASRKNELVPEDARCCSNEDQDRPTIHWVGHPFASGDLDSVVLAPTRVDARPNLLAGTGAARKALVEKHALRGSRLDPKVRTNRVDVEVYLVPPVSRTWNFSHEDARIAKSSTSTPSAISFGLYVDDRPAHRILIRSTQNFFVDLSKFCLVGDQPVVPWLYRTSAFAPCHCQSHERFEVGLEASARKIAGPDDQRGASLTREETQLRVK
jgi:hypothetical protein